MLKVRLQRIGRRNDPAYRVVVTDSRRGPKSLNYLESVGSYDPKRKQIMINGERIKHWIGVGAQVSGTVHNILVSKKVIDGKKINVLPKKSPIVKEEAKTSEASSPGASGEEASSEKAIDVPVVGAEVPAEKPKTEEAPVEEPTKDETEAEETNVAENDLSNVSKEAVGEEKKDA